MKSGKNLKKWKAHRWDDTGDLEGFPGGENTEATEREQSHHTGASWHSDGTPPRETQVRGQQDACKALKGQSLVS